MSKKKKEKKTAPASALRVGNGDSVNHPHYYNSHPSGVECIDIVRHYNFNVGNVIKYLWRHGLKHEQGMDDRVKALEDLRKARFYLDDEIKKLACEVWSADTETCRKAVVGAALSLKGFSAFSKSISNVLKSNKK